MLLAQCAIGVFLPKAPNASLHVESKPRCFVALQRPTAGAEDKPLHPDTDLVADILGQRPDVVMSTLSPIKDPRPPPFMHLPSDQEGQNPSALSCGGHLVAKINEVDTLFSPGEQIRGGFYLNPMLLYSNFLFN